MPPDQEPAASASDNKYKEYELEPGENVISHIHRHPIGLVYIYLEALAAIAALVILAYFLVPDSIRHTQSNSDYSIYAIVTILGIAFIVLILLMITNVFRQNQLIITNKGLIQILQKGPFSRKVSRLNMSDVEDVSSNQNGILQTIFNYGQLNIETSGEVENFIFPYCPNPTEHSKQISVYRRSNPRND